MGEWEEVENHKHFILHLGRGFIVTQDDACCIVVHV